MKLSVIIVNYNVKYFLELCLHSVLKAAEGQEVEVIVVDNDSKDGSCDMLREKYPAVTLIENTDNKGFSKANNQAVAIAKGEYILFLNPDTVMPEDFISKTIAYMDAHPKAGALGPRLIDGKGRFSPDSKKSLPGLATALFKTTGINKLFSRSPYFNRYYAVHIGQHETADVEVLSGCCMLLRRKVIDEIGGAFDEDYFMYCEDVDLSYRIRKAGYQNVYFPEATLIHYKGESTRKMTLSYLRIFNEALIKFARKHYGPGKAKFYVLLAKAGIVVRALSGALKMVFKLFRMPLFDAVILLLTLLLIKDFWVLHVKNILPIPLSSVYATFPVYIALWVICMYLNGAYDQPYRPWRVTRGMIVGTVFILAYYGMLRPELRYSRAIIIFTGAGGTAVLLGLHELLYKLGIFKFIPYDKLPRKAIIVGSEKEYEHTSAILQRVHYAPELSGRITASDNNQNALGNMGQMKQLLYTAAINEVIFCVNGLSYSDIFKQMQSCGDQYDYKIHLPGSMSFVGSNSSQSSGDLYTIDHRFNLHDFAQLRNKRMVDIGMALILLALSPLLIFIIRKPAGFLGNCFRVLFAQRTWISYVDSDIDTNILPRIKQGIIPPYNILGDYLPAREVKKQLYMVYARQYVPGIDISLILKNIKYLGGV